MKGSLNSLSKLIGERVEIDTEVEAEKEKAIVRLLFHSIQSVDSNSQPFEDKNNLLIYTNRTKKQKVFY
jgi:hypothetical protein